MSIDHDGTDLAERQRMALGGLGRARRDAERALSGAGASREARMDASRGRAVLVREHEAARARSRARSRKGATVLTRHVAPRAVVAHRHPWFSQKLVELLQGADVDVVAQGLENGADAAGVTAVEQPDLVLVEDGLLMLTGEEVVREIRRFCPDTVVAVHTAYGDRRAALLEAGASVVTTRPLPPSDVVRQALALLREE